MSDTNYDNLRVLPVETIDAMLAQIYNSNKEAFELYFNLIKAKEVNKLVAKPSDTDSKPPNSDLDASADNTSSDDKS